MKHGRRQVTTKEPGFRQGHEDMYPRRDERNVRVTDCEATSVITSAFASLSADPLALHAA